MAQMYDEIHIEALKYERRVDFQKKSKLVYQRAYRKGILDEVCSHMKLRFIWTLELIHQEALKYTTKGDFWRGSPSAYNYALANDMMDKVSGHMTILRKMSYSLDEVVTTAKKYENRWDFSRHDTASYQYALRHGWLDKVCNHMVNGKKNDRDIVYIWEVVNELWNDKPIYKIGFTSKRLGDNRLKMVTRASGFSFNVVNVFNVPKGYAQQLEIKLHKYGEIPILHKFDGHTEFRALTNVELLSITNDAEEFQRRTHEV